MTTLGIMLFGYLLSILIKLRNIIKAGNFSFKFWIGHNWIDIIINLGSAIAITLLKRDIFNYIPLNSRYREIVDSLLVYFLIGFFNYWILNLVLIGARKLIKKKTLHLEEKPNK